MIIFDLGCACGYQFEGWFKDRDDFDEQKAKKLICCPDCGSYEITKLLSPVAMKAAVPNSGSSQNVKGEEKAAMRILRTLQNFVKDNYENVGSRFADEALKMHYGVAEARNIRGVTTDQEEQMLKKEGIDLLKVPLPEEGPDEKGD